MRQGCLGLELAMEPKQASSPQRSSYLYLMSVGLKVYIILPCGISLVVILVIFYH